MVLKHPIINLLFIYFMLLKECIRVVRHVKKEMILIHVVAVKSIF